ncbi:hypothetical protein JCM10914A_01840 [Paenibacillus sp. JCM 10914]|uniref:GIY-YIG nuclease family protein n=1 Tax=Paenibacillus sp. JCM 10914 TaxID=1236974 RepID=UPI0003CC7C87|nr:GIY-YIG nuclease family protein [Paenibacillus sp. JCM 10914]GAE06885.1 hypothetical protein JCM10914_3074 [Paenibacillus sp. JCM 10914]
MFGTIIMDAYHRNEVRQIAEALDDLCSPNDSYGWASSGIYCFWNYYTQELYYIGLAVDLTERFKQHNGLIPVDPSSCKYEKINEYFNNYDKIGFSIFVQSPLSQAVTRRNIYEWFGYDPAEVKVRDFGRDGFREQLKILEGILIETFRMNRGSLPPWNAVSGSIAGQLRAKKESYEIINLLTSTEPSPFTARFSLRELSSNPVLEGYENFLHSARIMTLNTGIPFINALRAVRSADMAKIHEQLLESNYFTKKIII